MEKRPIIFSRKMKREKINLSKDLRRNMTKSETLVWERIRAHRIGGLHFRRQAVINPYIVDFYCHSLKLVVEIDGGVHESQREMDAERDRFLTALGLRVVRIPNQRVLVDIEEAMEEIESACQEQEGLTPPPSPPQNGEGC